MGHIICSSRKLSIPSLWPVQLGQFTKVEDLTWCQYGRKKWYFVLIILTVSTYGASMWCNSLNTQQIFTKLPLFASAGLRMTNCHHQSIHQLRWFDPHFIRASVQIGFFWDSIQIQQTDSYVTWVLGSNLLQCLGKPLLSYFLLLLTLLRISVYSGRRNSAEGYFTVSMVCILLNADVRSIVAFISIWNKYWMPSIPRCYYWDRRPSFWQ